VLLERVLAADFVISFTAVQREKVPDAEAIEDVDEVEDVVSDFLLLLLSAQVRLTTSPDFTSLSTATALPWTGSVWLLAVEVALEVMLELEPAAAASRTVIVFPLASTETTSATSGLCALVDVVSVRAWVLLVAAAESDDSDDELLDGLTAGDFVELLEPLELLVLGSWACSAAARPAARTRLSSTVTFFMFPPVARLCGPGRPAPGRLRPRSEWSEECVATVVARYDFHTSIMRFMPVYVNNRILAARSECRPTGGACGLNPLQPQ
jgi:hypothetical protein